jgi:NAD(P)-dependent dehydrogenase (short-subunit alcohol dehydrogenase family)
MSILLNGELALVTGASRGIGQAIASRLATAGARVAVTSRRLEDAERVATTLGDGHRGYSMDVTSSAAVDETVVRICSDMGVPTILINNAGVNRLGPTQTMSDEDWEAVIDVNLTGVFRCCRAVGSRMVEDRRGTIVNIASIIGTGTAMPWRAPYAASKAGVVGLTQMLAVEWAGAGVRVNAILPGPTMTPMVRDAIASGKVSERNVIDRTPAGRFGEAADVADAVLLLCTQESAFITGQSITVDGGYTMWGASHPASRRFDDASGPCD